MKNRIVQRVLACFLAALTCMSSPLETLPTMASEQSAATTESSEATTENTETQTAPSEDSSEQDSTSDASGSSSETAAAGSVSENVNSQEESENNGENAAETTSQSSTGESDSTESSTSGSSDSGKSSETENASEEVDQEKTEKGEETDKDKIKDEGNEAIVITGFPNTPSDQEYTIGEAPAGSVVVDNLGSELEASLSDGSTENVAVDWTCDSYAPETAGVYVFSSSLKDDTHKLNDGVTMPEVRVTIDKKEKTKIVSWDKFADLSYDLGTDLETVRKDFPSQIKGTDQDGNTVTVDVKKWSCDDFSSDKAGEYTFLAEIDEDTYEAQESAKIRVHILGAFSQSKEVDGVKITVEAASGVFPDGAKLEVSAASQEESDKEAADRVDENAEKAKKAESDQENIGRPLSYENDTTIDKNAGDSDVAVSQLNYKESHPEGEKTDKKEVTTLKDEYDFDIRILDEDGKEIQPDTSKGKVSVTFTADAVGEDKNTVSVFHLKDGEAKQLDGKVSDTSFTTETDGFSHFIMRVYKAETVEQEATGWGWNVYYVRENDYHDVTKTDDFNLKYQVEFHAAKDLDVGKVKITVPRCLLQDREGNDINPNDISVPRITADQAKDITNSGNYKENDSTPFNYYVDDKETKDTGDDTLVFINYRKIANGTNTSFQVLYKNVDISTIKDDEKWSLQPSIQVTVKDSEGNDVVQTQKVDPLTGVIDTSAVITSVSRKPYTEYQKSYTPGLYTKKQVLNYAKYFAQKTDGSGYLSENDIDTEKYCYVVWEVTATGKANQPFTLSATQSGKTGNTENGIVVGYTVRSIQSNNVGFDYDSGDETGKAAEETKKDTNATKTIFKDQLYKDWKADLLVVMAYPYKSFTEPKNNTKLTDDVTFTVTPSDGIDAPMSMSTKDLPGGSWTYQNFDWSLPGGGGEQGTGVTVTNTDYEYLVDNDSQHRQYSGAWTVLYNHLITDGKDYGSYPYTTTANTMYYDITHPKNNGYEYKPNTYLQLTAATDALYGYGTTSATADDLLDSDDYYYSSVTVERQDRGYDFYNGENADPEYPGTGTDFNSDYYTTTIYAMFGNDSANSSDEWVKVKEIDGKKFGKSGKVTYSFSSEEIAKKPYRVKVVYNTTNVISECKIYTKVTLKHGEKSHIVELLKDEKDNSAATITLDQLGIAMGYAINRDNNQDSRTPIYLSRAYGDKVEPGLADLTRSLYELTGDDLPQRSNSFKTLTPLKEYAEAHKYAETENDPDHSRTIMNFVLTAYDGYATYSGATKEELGGEFPDRSEVVFYDLLPFGMKYYAANTVTVGRITNATNISKDDTWTKQPKSWNKNDVTLTSAPKLTENWKGTGRTMVEFHLKYTGADPSVLNNDHWYTGYGVAFSGYLEWKDLDSIKNSDAANRNIFAYILENATEKNQLLGQNDGYKQVCEDDGTYDDGTGKSVSLSGYYADFAVGDINDNKDRKEHVLYADVKAMDDIALSSESKIDKKVRADNDVTSSYVSSTSVVVGETYTYDISVSSANQEGLSNIVLFDRLEDPDTDQHQDEKTVSNDEEWKSAKTRWHGTLESVDTKAASMMGADPVVWYHTGINDFIPAEQVNKKIDYDKVLTSKNGWVKATEYKGNNSEVNGVAIDLRQASNSNETVFTLKNGSTISAYIKMKAPDYKEEELSKLGGKYAYNDAFYYQNGSENKSVSPITKVAIGLASYYAVEKEFTKEDEVPQALKDADFEFHVTLDGSAYRDQQYTLYEKDGSGLWVEKDPTILHATDGNGVFTLKAGQKAEFKVNTTIRDKGLEVEETENPLWKSEKKTSKATDNAETKAAKTTTVLFKNTYRPVLYFAKKFASLPQDADKLSKIDNEEFEFRIEKYNKETNTYSPVEMTYWYVDQVRLDGGAPKKVAADGKDTEPNGDSPEDHKTSDDGKFILKRGQTIVLFADAIGSQYQITELGQVENNTVNKDVQRHADDTTSLYMEDFICDSPSVTTTTKLLGTSSSITNTYRWKDLKLTKTITNQNAEDVSTKKPEFTFQVMSGKGKKTEKVTTRNAWYLLDADGNKSMVSGESGNLDKDGCLSIAGNRTVVIEGLDAEQTYTIMERADCIPKDDSGRALYQPMDNGMAVVEMPFISRSRSAEITNQYLKRPIVVEKQVVSSDQSKLDEAVDKEFNFTLKVNGSPERNTSYVLYKNGQKQEGTFSTDENGEFKLTPNEKAYFDAAVFVDDTYEVTETKDAYYPPIYPATNSEGNSVASGTVTWDEDEVKITFLNGTSGSLIVRKNLAGDANGFDDVKFAFRLTINGKTQESQTCTVVNNTSGVTQTATVNTAYFGVSPDEMYVFSVKPTDTYELSEVSSEKNTDASYVPSSKVAYWKNDGTFTGTEGWYQIQQTSPAIGKSVTGTVSENPVAEITNTVTRLFENSVIYKEISGTTVPAPGSTLKFTVEQYNGSGWEPVSGVQYFRALGSGSDSRASSTETMQTTDDKGTVSLTMPTTETGISGTEIPHLVFPNDTVKINPLNPAKGTLRITENAEFNQQWGILIGYKNHNNNDAYSMDASDADTFVNGNRTAQIEVAKEFDGTAPNTEFTFHLYQETAWTDGDISSADLTKEQIGAGVHYAIYDTSTNRKADSGDHVTDDNGTFQLKPGQYAVFDVVENTLWRASESTANMSGYKISSINGNLEDKNTGNKRTHTDMTKMPTSGLLLAKKGNPVVTFICNDDAGTVLREEAVNGTVSIPDGTTYTKNGYTFKGWYVGDTVFKGSGITSDTTVVAEWTPNTPSYSETFTYSNMDKQVGYYTFVVPYTGKYKVILSGANGGQDALTDVGLGAVISGKVKLQKGTVLYIYVGQKGSNGVVGIGGGYNGGGNAGHSGSSGGGGGATDIRTVNGNKWNTSRSLRSRIAVAAGGGGDGVSKKGGDGGWAVGNIGNGTGTGGTQYAGGTSGGAFGIGANRDESAGTHYDGGGAGGGWFGGGVSHSDDGAAGGSSFMPGGTYEENGVTKTMSYQNSAVTPYKMTNPATGEDYIFTDAKLIDHNTGNYMKDSGNGWATIKLISQ